LDYDKRVSQSDAFLWRAGVFVIFCKSHLGETIEECILDGDDDLDEGLLIELEISL
jgi:hypothetical protein